MCLRACGQAIFEGFLFELGKAGRDGVVGRGRGGNNSSPGTGNGRYFIKDLLASRRNAQRVLEFNFGDIGCIKAPANLASQFLSLSLTFALVLF